MAADIIMSYCFDSMDNNGLLDGYPNCTGWVAQMKAEPGYSAAIKKDGEGSAVFSFSLRLD